VYVPDGRSDESIILVNPLASSAFRFVADVVLTLFVNKGALFCECVIEAANEAGIRININAISARAIEELPCSVGLDWPFLLTMDCI
jgi:hypothetical protein